MNTHLCDCLAVGHEYMEEIIVVSFFHRIPEDETTKWINLSTGMPVKDMTRSKSFRVPRHIIGGDNESLQRNASSLSLSINICV